MATAMRECAIRSVTSGGSLRPPRQRRNKLTTESRRHRENENYGKQRPYPFSSVPPSSVFRGFRLRQLLFEHVRKLLIGAQLFQLRAVGIFGQPVAIQL